MYMNFLVLQMPIISFFNLRRIHMKIYIYHCQICVMSICLCNTRVLDSNILAKKVFRKFHEKAKSVSSKKENKRKSSRGFTKHKVLVIMLLEVIRINNSLFAACKMSLYSEAKRTRKMKKKVLRYID